MPSPIAVAQWYDSQEVDQSFDALLSEFQPDDDAALAELIETDGRCRISRGLSVDLQRYLSSVPELEQRPDALDAAIDMASRALARTSRTDQQVIDRLISAYPHLQRAITEAAALNNAVWSTTGLRARIAAPPVPRQLPCEFGPVSSDGECRFELRELLGEGAYGQVFLAVDRRLSEKDHQALVSIKVLSGRQRSTMARQRLIEEASKARRVEHHHVVGVLDRGLSDDGEDYIVYQYIDGGDLNRWYRRHRSTLTLHEAVRIVSQISRGVHAAHMAGLVHCDIKPGNIMLTAEGVPKVADFGIAVRPTDHPQISRATDDESQTEPAGNLAFMSPEQFRMEPGALTIPSDIYALGGILFWLITGEYPNGSKPDEIARTHDPTLGRRQPPELRSTRYIIDQTLQEICARAMALKPADRYSSAAALADDLDAWLGNEPIVWTKPSFKWRLVLWKRRNPIAFFSITAFLVLLLSAGGFSWRLAVIAERERLVAEEAKARSAAEQGKRDAFIKILIDFRNQENTNRSKGVNTSLLPQMWGAEWLFGPTVLGRGIDMHELWDFRKEIVRNLADKELAAGRGKTLEFLLWETSLAFWLVLDGSYVEADERLTQAIPDFESLLQREDPWLSDVRGLHACAKLGLWPADGDRTQLESIAATLSKSDQSLEVTNPGSPMHRVILRHLAIALDDKHLDEISANTDAKARLDNYTLIYDPPPKPPRRPASSSSATP